jgi:AbrB family looped-hinge helix DNA binding protein
MKFFHNSAPRSLPEVPPRLQAEFPRDYRRLSELREQAGNCIAFLSESVYTTSRDYRDIPNFDWRYITAMSMLVENAKVMAKGQITLPKDIRDILGIGTGDRVTLICQNNQVIMVNAAVYAMNILQEGMKGEFEKAGINDDDDVMDLVKEVRREIEGL